MQLEYTLTIDDLKDALAPVRPDGTFLSKRPSRRARIGFALFGLFAGMLIFLLFFAPSPGRPPMPPAPINPPQDLTTILIPTVVPAIFITWLTVFAMLSVNRRKKSESAAKTRHRQNTLFFIILILAAAGLVAANSEFAIIWHPSRRDLLFVGFLPWILFLIVAALAVFLTRRRRRQALWDRSTHLHLKKQVQIDESGIQICDELQDLRFKWPYFDRFQEREPLFLLYHDNSLHILPKRAFAALPDGDPQMDRLRGILHDHVRNGTFLARTSAFPVIQPMSEPPFARIAPPPLPNPPPSDKH